MIPPARFVLANITIYPTWLNYALVGPVEQTIEFAYDVLEDDSYKTLKEQFIKHPSLSEVAKLKHLLTGLMLGACTPSQLLCEIKQLGGDKVGRATRATQGVVW